LQELDTTKIYQGLASQGYSFDIDSTIPVGKGLGSSAATSVSTASALLCLFDKLSVGQRLHEDLQLVNTIAFEYERVYHSNPSGVDNYVSCNGGLVVFNRTSKDYKRLEWPFVDLSILLIDSEVEKNTKKAVEHVRFLYNN
jgi:mevalonate kinase